MYWYLRNKIAWNTFFFTSSVYLFEVRLGVSLQGTNPILKKCLKTTKFMWFTKLHTNFNKNNWNHIERKKKNLRNISHHIFNSSLKHQPRPWPNHTYYFLYRKTTICAQQVPCQVASILALPKVIHNIQDPFMTFLLQVPLVKYHVHAEKSPIRHQN